MCLAGIVPANESTRLTKSMVPVMMDGVCSPAYIQQTASSVFPVYQAPLKQLWGQARWTNPSDVVVEYLLGKLINQGRSTALIWGMTRLSALCQREEGQKRQENEVSHYVQLQQRTEHVGGVCQAHPDPASSCREDIWASDAMSAGPPGWWAVGILSLCFGEPSSCFRLAEAQISQYGSLPEIGANFHIRASRGSRSLCCAGQWGAAEPWVPGPCCGCGWRFSTWFTLAQLWETAATPAPVPLC